MTTCEPDCSACPFASNNRGGPVEASRPTRKPRFAIVGEGPGADEVTRGRPFVGASGDRLERGLQDLGLSRGDLLITNATMCRPPEHTTEGAFKKAVAACRGRLVAELADVKHVLAVGRWGFNAASGLNVALATWIGGVLHRDGHVIVPTVHPAFCMRGNAAWWPVFFDMLERLALLASGRVSPHVWQPMVTSGHEETKEQLAQILAEGLPTGIDIETAGMSATDRMTAIGLANINRGVSIYLQNGEVPNGAKKLVSAILAAGFPKIGHNVAYDLIGLRAAGYEINGTVHDTIMAHHVVANQLPHGLGFVSHLAFPVDPWKALFRLNAGFKRATREQLTEYNGKDAAILSALWSALRAQLEHIHRGASLYKGYHARTQITSAMFLEGIHLDSKRLAQHKQRLFWRLRQARKAFRDAQKLVPARRRPPLVESPSSNVKLRHLLVDTYGVVITKRSKKTGAVSITDDVLQELSAHPSPWVCKAARATLRFRRAAKLYGTYIKPYLRFPKPVAHPWFRAYGTKTGRWNCQKPNVQNIPKGLRDIFIAAPGAFFIEADYSQLELRIIALLSHDEPLLALFTAGGDPHLANAKVLFPGAPFDTMSSDTKKKLRKLAKVFVYATNYGGTPETIWASIVAVQPSISLTDIVRMQRLWFAAHPAIKTYLSTALENAILKDFVELPLSGRRVKFYHDVEPSKVYNLPIQGTGADIIDAAIVRAVPRLKGKLKLQEHDALVVESPRRFVAHDIKVLREEMARPVELEGASVSFPVDVSVGPRWGKGMVELPAAVTAKVLKQTLDTFNAKA